MTWAELCEYHSEGNRERLERVLRDLENTKRAISEWEDAKNTLPTWRDWKNGSNLQAVSADRIAGSLVRQSVHGGTDIWRAQIFEDGSILSRVRFVADREAAKRYVEKALGLPECETVEGKDD